MELAAAERDRTRLLAEEMTDLAYEVLAPEDVEQVKRLLLDHAGVTRRGADMSWSRALAGWAATAGAKLYDLDAEGMAQTWGLVLSAAGGSMQFSQDGERHHGQAAPRRLWRPVQPALCDGGEHRLWAGQLRRL